MIISIKVVYESRHEAKILMDKLIHINLRKIFKVHKQGDAIESIITYRDSIYQEWYEGYSQKKREIRIDLWIIVLYFTWWSKKMPLN